MASSVIDYIFRDLAISYLKRHDLGQVKPEESDNTTDISEPLGKDKKEVIKEEIESESKDSNGTESDDGSIEYSEDFIDEQGEKINEARLKGYEGDPCPTCGAFTLIRNGTCMKCDTCGNTTGCS
jgi:ribonucleoside-diphosphate reductase alpha chain